MCGIYVSTASRAQQKVLAGLKRLEYRGYDSWGIAALENGELAVEKHVGKIGGVAGLQLPNVNLAIGHTRWATHGGVTETNAHPHCATSGAFCLVQNGVVENYQELKAQLSADGYHFKTQTDTEVIVALLEKELGDTGQVTLEMFAKVCQKLAGRSTVAVLTKESTVLVYRNGSPLVIGKGAEGIVFSSDVLSLSEDATEYALVENGQIAVLENGSVQLFDAQRLDEQEILFHPIELEANKLDTEGFDHFMLKEIFEQTKVLVRVTEQPEGLYERITSVLHKAKTIYIVGAGSASFAAGHIAYALREKGIQAVELKSYEAKSYRTLFTDQDVCIAISQSGETADTNEVVEWMKEQGMTIVSLVNMAGSTLASMSDLAFKLQVGPEVAVASTKAFAGQVIWGKSLAHILAGGNLEEFQTQLKDFQESLSVWMQDETVQQTLKKVASQLVSHEHLFVLGRGQLYMSAQEFALKMKEISYIHAEGFSGGELKHGVIALIDQGTPVVCLVANDEETADMLSAVAEVKARGGHIIGVALENNELFDTWIPLPADHRFVSVSSFIPAQFMTYYAALEKGYDPDKPRNLAKSVTVK